MAKKFAELYDALSPESKQRVEEQVKWKRRKCLSDPKFDRQIANQLIAMLNREYGDSKLSGAIHPHRAPGFENRKPKRKGQDGHFPIALLRHAVQHICKKSSY